MSGTATPTSPGEVGLTSSRPQVVRGWLYLVGWTFTQVGRLRLVGWVSLVLAALTVLWVAVENQRGRWDYRQRRLGRGGPTVGQVLDSGLLGKAVLSSGSPTLAAAGGGLLAAQAVVLHPQFQAQWGFMNYSRWVVHGVYLGFLLPLLTLAYATPAFAAERENRTLIWIATRPLPRSSIYLAKWLGSLPWCWLATVGILLAWAAVGGTYGQQSWRLYAPAAVAGTFALSAVFHCLAAFFRKPIVWGLIYVFFFEALVGSMPGALKQLSLTFHMRSIMYNAAAEAGYPVELLALPEAVEAATAWTVLLATPMVISGIGAYLYGITEDREDW